MVGVEGVKGPIGWSRAIVISGFARPKSISLAPPLVSMMFAGFRSRWMMPCWCAFSRAMRDFRADLQDLIERQRAFRQAVSESLAFEIFHHQEVGAVLRADIVEGADVRMLQRGNGPGFPLHPLLQFGVRGKMRRQNLDGDGAVEAGVLGAVNLAHAPSAEERDEFHKGLVSCRG